MIKVNIALTGASGNMGKETLRQLVLEDCVGKIKTLILDDRQNRRFAKKIKKLYQDKVEVIFGDIVEIEKCRVLVKDTDYVINLAAVIPPKSDHFPELAERCNHLGARNITDSVCEIANKQPKLIHVSTVALYGHRDYQHPWARVGDPLMPSAYDCYAAGKLKGERYVLDSDVQNFVVLRQSAMLHNKMLNDNLNDGLMFHTCLNTPLEWVTARDSGTLIRKIVAKDVKNEIKSFWKKCYNIGGGYDNRITGYETFNGGFKLIGGSTEKFLRPNWQAERNFHGVWFSDGDILNNLFDYQRDTMDIYWAEILQNHKYYKLAKFISPKIISRLCIERLLSNSNAPHHWIQTNQEGKVKAYFYQTPKTLLDWKDYPILSKGKVSGGDIDYDNIRKLENVKKMGYLLNHGYDETKEKLDINDMKSAAVFRGGKCLSDNMQDSDMYTKLEWQCHNNHKFFASPYTVLKAGHWCPECCQPQPWNYDKLAKHIPFFAQIWYDSHAKEENLEYYFNDKMQALYQKFDIKRKAIIYNFSGTGNTSKICNLFKENFEKKGVLCDIYDLKQGFQNLPSPESYDIMCIAYPIYGFNAPSILIDFINELETVVQKNYYIIKTSGEPLSLNSASSAQLVRKLDEKGYIFGGEFHYVMPYNMIFRHTNYMVKRMWQAAKYSVPKDANSILNNIRIPFKPSFFSRIIAAILLIQHPSYRILGRFFTVDKDKCIDCGKCIKACPTNNIKMSDGKITFSKNCICCVRCSFNCPTNAINIGILNKWKVNGAYDFNNNDTYGQVCDYCHDAYCKYFEDNEKELKPKLKSFE